LVATGEIGADYSDQPFNCNPTLPAILPADMAPSRANLQVRPRLVKPAAHDCAVNHVNMANRVRKPAPDARRGTLTGSQEPLERIALALERLAPDVPGAPSYELAEAFSWHPDRRRLVPVAKVNRVDMSLLKGIDQVRDMLVENTDRFARGLPANNALLWGARGMGKSSLVKAVHASVNAAHHSGGRMRGALKLVEIHREDIESLPDLMALMRGAAYRFIVFCDDLSFETEDTSYKSLKAMLEGGIEGRPHNVVFYATSNRRHLMPRDMVENERSSAINPGEAVEEKVSLSDRFGLWLGFHRCSQDEFLAMVDGYVSHYRIEHPREMVHREALEWATTRGARSGRVAWQFVQDLAGRLGIAMPDDG
jgi:predicted AAA+ superfamily ATPase